MANVVNNFLPSRGYVSILAVTHGLSCVPFLLTLCIMMSFSTGYDTINFGWYIVYFEGHRFKFPAKTAGKGLTSWPSCLLCLVTFPNVSWSTSELRARLAP